MKEKQIIDSARELFEKYGIKKTSMDEIAKNAGVTKKTVYSYFSSKNELINYFVKEELNYMKSIVEKYEAKDGDYFENVHQGLCKMLNYKKKSIIINIFMKEADDTNLKVLKDNLNRIDTQTKNYIKEVLEKAEKAGHIKVKNIDIVTFLIYKMYIALMFDWDEGDKELDDKEIADNILQILRNGLSNK